MCQGEPKCHTSTTKIKSKNNRQTDMPSLIGLYNSPHYHCILNFYIASDENWNVAVCLKALSNMFQLYYCDDQ